MTQHDQVKKTTVAVGTIVNNGNNLCLLLDIYSLRNKALDVKFHVQNGLKNKTQKNYNPMTDWVSDIQNVFPFVRFHNLRTHSENATQTFKE